MKAVNLLPGEQRATGKTPIASAATPAAGGSAFGAYVVLGVLALAVAASALYVLATNSIKSDKAELARVSQEATAVKAQAGSLQAFADFKTLSTARVATVKGLAASRFAWQRTLDDVSRALPSDVYVSSLDGSTTGSGGGSGLRGAISAPAIEIDGCTKSQASVARMMSHLRGVRGVTRVSLSKSEVSDATSTAALAQPPTANATLPGEKAKSTFSEPCPKGSPPSFNVVIFFERSVVTAAAAPNAALTRGASGGPTGPAGATTSTTSGPTGAAGATTPATSTTP